MKKICLFSPYLLQMHAGGGEKHFFDKALSLARDKKSVIFVAVTQNTQHTLEEYRQFFTRFIGKKLDKIKFIWTPLFTEASFWSKVWWTRQFDQLYYVTDGSLFLSLAKKNILHVQIPFTQQKNSVLERFKLLCWQEINTNSEFTKNVIEKSWKVKVGAVIRPKIDPGEFKPAKNRLPMILAVGRFFSHLHSKRQDILVECFRELRKTAPSEFRDWQLVFVGAVEDRTYFDKVQNMAKDLPVKFVTSATRKELVDYFNTATIFWHAAGFGVDEKKEPEKVEHFGIVTLEAMAAGCVPVVVAKGGQKEILTDHIPFLGWNKVSECVKITHLLVNDQKIYKLILSQINSLII